MKYSIVKFCISSGSKSVICELTHRIFAIRKLSKILKEQKSKAKHGKKNFNYWYQIDSKIIVVEDGKKYIVSIEKNTMVE